MLSLMGFFVGVHMEITQELLRSRYAYDPLTGSLKNKISIGLAKKGEEAGSLTKEGYKTLSVNRTFIMAHRAIWILMTGSQPIGDIDHIDGCPSNNSWSNLRQASRSQNLCNTAIRKNKSSSGVKGVHFCKNSNAWLARLRINGRMVYREAFKTLEEAAIAIKTNRERIHGEFARHE